MTFVKSIILLHLLG